MAEGIRVVEDLLASDLSVRWSVTASSLEDTPRGAALIAEIDRRAIPRRGVPDREFDRLAATESPQGVIAVAEIPAADLVAIVAGDDPGILLVLDAVQDPGNFGTLTRSAEAFDARGVIALAGTVDPWNPKSVRAAAGASFRIPIVQASWSEVLPILRDAGFTTLGATMEGGALGGGLRRAALVVGNEGAGLSGEVAASVDRLVGIETPGRAESLNVGAAAAILLYELHTSLPKPG